MDDADERADGSDSLGTDGDPTDFRSATGLGGQDERRPGAVVIGVAIVVMVLFVGLLAYSLLTRETISTGPPGQGNIAAPSVTLSQLNGDGEVSLSDFSGTPIVVNFWASWCAPCRVEMPHLVAAHDRYADQGVTFIGVAIQDTAEDALAFIDEFNVPVDAGYVMVSDPDGVATIDYGVGGLPVTFFIRRDGTVHTRWAGVVNAEVLDERIAEIIA